MSITRKLTEILETFPRVFCFPKSRINENGGKQFLMSDSICLSYIYDEFHNAKIN